MKKTKLALVILIIVIALAFLLWPKKSDPVYFEGTLVDPTIISQEIENNSAVLLDVRTELELAQDGYAVDSEHFDITKMQRGELPDFSKDKKVYIYCKSGGRAGQAEEILESNGFTDVVNIGGLVDWEAAGGNTVK